ncbi:hypothetical protein ES703_19448 [subsurface metagenome]
MTLSKVEENIGTKSPLPQGWRWVRLGDVARVFAGSAAPQGKEFFDTTGPPFVRVSDLGKYKRTTCLVNMQDKLSTKAIDEYSLVLAQKGSILFPKSGAAIGTNNRAILGTDAYIVSHLMAVEPSSETTSLWLYWVLLQLDMLDFSDNIAYPSLKQSTVQSIKIPLPPLTEQKHIAHILNERMALVEKARTAAEARLESAKALPAAYLRQVFPQLSQALPLGWRWARLGDVFDVKQGVAMSPLRRQGVAPRPFLRTLNVLWGFVDLSNLDKMSFTDDEVTSLNLRNGDLLVCEGGDVGRTAIWRGKLDVCLYQNHVHRLRRRNDSIIPDFYLYWMQVAFKVFQSYKGKEITTTIPNLSGGQLKSFLMPLPPTNEQKRIASLLSEKIVAVEKTVQTLQQELETINALPAALLRRAFAGGL